MRISSARHSPLGVVLIALALSASIAACSDTKGTVVTAPIDTSSVNDSVAGGADTAGEPDAASPSDVAPPSDTSAADTGADDVPDRELPPAPVDVLEIPDGAQCAPGAGFCDGNTLFYCLADGSGYAGKGCTTSCKNGACVGEPKICQANTIFCDKEEARLLKCAADGLSASFVQVCQHGCNVKTSDCKDADDCQEGETFCTEDQKSVLVCNETETEFVLKEKCAFGCGSGVCLGAGCEKGATQCGEKGVDVCKPDLTGFVLQTPCPEGCIVAFGAPTCAQCEEGSFKCNVYDVEKCTDPLVGWDVVTTCDLSETCAQGACVDLLFLSDPKESAAFAVANAFLECIDAGQAKICGGFQTLELTADLSLDDLRDAVCGDNSAGAVEGWFSSPDAYSAALDLFGCGALDQVDVKFEVDAIHANKDGLECYRYTGGGGLFSDDIAVSACE